MKPAWRALIAPGMAVLAGLAILIGLGEWQLQRMIWKEALISAVATRAHTTPAELPPPDEWARLKPSEYEYAHVRVRGVYDLGHQALVFRALERARGRYAGQGYLVITPLKLASGASVLVNRGFVPIDKKDAAGAPAGEVEVTGLMRASEPRNFFTPPDNPAQGDWYTRDIAAIAADFKLENPAPFSIDADAGAPGELPQGGETILAFPNNHLEYALTWFGMALALAAVFAAYALQKLRSDASGPRNV